MKNNIKREINYQQFLLFILLFTSLSVAQVNLSDLKFDKQYFESVDQLVVIQTSKENLFALGYIYLDQDVGFTLESMGKLLDTENGLKFEEPLDELKKMAIKIRLPRNMNNVAVLTQQQKQELKIPDPPEWFAFYKQDSVEVSYLKSIGYQYNHVGASNLALKTLQKAYLIDPHFEGLEYELAYAYNAMSQFNEAIQILEKAVENNNKDQNLYKEYGFALVNSNQINKAEKIFHKSLKLAKNDNLKGEIAFNMVQVYFKIRNEKKFKYWLKKFKKYDVEDSQLSKVVENYEKQWE